MDNDKMVAKAVATLLSAKGRSSKAEDWVELQRLAKLTALRVGNGGEFYVSNFWRGPLLYTLVLDRKPKHVLEIGTGRGYGALSMARAAVDGGLDTTVWTVDERPSRQQQPWAIDEGDGPRVEDLSVEDVWERHVPNEVRERVCAITGDSRSVLSRWLRTGRPAVDLVFIDGGHDYWTVKHDFLATLRVANLGVVLLFDDYGERVRYGVKRLIDREVAPKIPPGALVVIDTGAEDSRPDSAKPEHKMVLLTTNPDQEPGEAFYSKMHQAAFMAVYPFTMTVGRGLLRAYRSIRKR